MANRKVYNLSPDRIDTSDNQEDSEYKVYEERLDDAFKNPNIRNIAVTGNFGIGKSRFLRYYDKKRKFLFVSGCSFMETDSKDEIKHVEYNLMYQLLLGCRRYMGSGLLHGMPLSWLIILAIITGLLLLCTVFLLTLATKLGPYLRELGWYNNTANSIVHIAVYVGLIVILCIDLFVLLWRGKHFLSLKSISLELGSTKLSFERQEDSTFFDQNKHALLSSLVDAADQIDHTVVFEDMDRLEKADCLALFTKLWELNQEVNLYIGKGKKTIRFIYVLHDELFSPKSTENGVAYIAPDAHIQLKFFDYILPIVPRMSQKDAIISAKSFLADDDDLDEILTKISPYLSDYRLLKNIANEYQVFSEIEKERRNESDKGEKRDIISTLFNYFSRKTMDNGTESKLNKDKKEKLLALVIYKNLMPWDYKKIRESRNNVLPTVSEMDRIPEAVQILLNRKWLDASCLHFVGYDRERLQKLIKAVFQQGKECAASKKHWLEREFNLCCEIAGDDFNLEGVEFTFAEMAVRNEKEKGITILEEYKGNPAVETCSEEQLKQIHVHLGLSGKSSALNDEEKLVVLYFLARMDCHILWKIIPGLTDGLDTVEDIWWGIFCRLDKDALTCLVKCCEYKSDDYVGQRNYLVDWIECSSILKKASWEEQLPQNSHVIKEFIKKWLVVPVS